MPTTEQQERQGLLPGYLIIGTDELKRSQAIDRLKARLDSSGMAIFNIDERDMTKDVQIGDIIASLNTLPMGSDFRLVVLYGCDKLAKAVSEPLVEYFSHPSSTTVCLVVAEKLAKSTRLYKAIDALGSQSIISCEVKKAKDLPQTVVKMATAYGKRMNIDAAIELVDRVGENTRLIDSHIAKLASMNVGEAITKADVEKHVARTSSAAPWTFLNAVAARDVTAALTQLKLQPAGSEVRLWSLTVTRLRELIIAKSLAARGQASQLASTLGVRDWQVKNHHAWARKWSMEELEQALSSALDTELALKGSRDSKLAFYLWINSLVGDSK